MEQSEGGDGALSNLVQWVPFLPKAGGWEHDDPEVLSNLNHSMALWCDGCT